MKPAVSVVVVSHRSAAEAAACVASLRSVFEADAVDGEVVLVDCGSGPDEARKVEAIPAEAHLLLADNRGYSGGANAGMARARADRLLLANADVMFQNGAVRALLEEIEAPEVGAAAPLCVWDRAGRIRLPADSSRNFWDELAERHAGKGSRGEDRRFASFARRTLRLWERGGEARHLVGAVLATRREVLDRVGPFDERFLFEYEETEWEERVRRVGLSLRFSPRARVRHLFARSASRNPETERRREASRRLYWRTRYGRLGRAILERKVPAPVAPPARPIAEPRVGARAGAWVAISTNPSLIPFAGAPLDEDFCLPAEVAESLRPGPVFLRVFLGADGRPLETMAWERP
jgi:N-acetylglucosaminyl-diphospho-decaprenol L-rhamnosyltransferase